MKPALPLLVFALTMAAWPAWGQSQTRSAQVYRCGPEGRDLRDSPCPNAPGTAASAVTYDQPSDADSRAARTRHLAEAREAGALAQARRASEAEARQQRSRAVGLQAAPPPPRRRPALRISPTPSRPGSPSRTSRTRRHRPPAPADRMPGVGARAGRHGRCSSTGIRRASGHAADLT